MPRTDTPGDVADSAFDPIAHFRAEPARRAADVQTIRDHVIG
jgi:hypothetical protein